jgi:phosphoglycerate dehydrogenase-like enzyme
VLAWLPYPSRDEAVRRLGGLPDDLEVGCLSVGGELPGDIDRVEFIALPYELGPGPLARVAEMTSLRAVLTQTAGYEVVADVLPPSVTLCNAAGVHDASTAELAVGLMLSLGRHLDGAARRMSAGTWKQEWGVSLADRRVLIVGYGSIGAAIERRLAGFEVASVTRVARRARPEAPGQPLVHPVEDLDALLPLADIVVLVMPHTEATDRMFDARRLALMSDGATLINVGRGRLVDTDALVAETVSGRLRAGLDVVDPEPLPADHPLWQSPGVLISSHSGGASTAFWPRTDALIASQLGRWLRGEPLLHVVAGPGATAP